MKTRIQFSTITTLLLLSASFPIAGSAQEAIPVAGVGGLSVDTTVDSTAGGLSAEGGAGFHAGVVAMLPRGSYDLAAMELDLQVNPIHASGTTGSIEVGGVSLDLEAVIGWTELAPTEEGCAPYLAVGQRARVRVDAAAEEQNMFQFGYGAEQGAFCRSGDILVLVGLEEIIDGTLRAPGRGGARMTFGAVARLGIGEDVSASVSARVWGRDALILSDPALEIESSLDLRVPETTGYVGADLRVTDSDTVVGTGIENGTDVAASFHAGVAL